jgi:shikimate dehydrogenase
VRVVPFDDVSGLEVDLIVNATPLGIHGEELPLPPLPVGVIGVDLLYRPGVTPFQRAVRDAGGAAFGGLGLLLQQAAISFELWTGQSAPLPVMSAAALGELAEPGTPAQAATTD